MDKPLRVYQFKAEAHKWAIKLSNKKGGQYEVHWYNLKPGWGKYKGWEVFALEKEAMQTKN